MHNPTAGDGRHDAGELVARVAAAGHEVVYRSTDDDGWIDALSAPSDVVVAAGGDGTVRKVFAALEPGRRVSLIPLGSANNIACSVGLAPVEDVTAVARRWHRAAPVAFDVGLVELGDRTVRFVEAVGGGVFADVLRRASRRPGLEGERKVRAGLEMLREATADATPRPWELSLDGEDLSGEYLAVEALNLPQIGPHMPLSPDADPGDGLMDLVLVSAADRPAMLEWIDTLRDDGGEAARGPGLPVRRGRLLGIGVPSGGLVHVDDDLGPEGPYRATVRLGSIRLDLLTPAGERD
jgi:diacylglycerol kinase (ATP)